MSPELERRGDLQRLVDGELPHGQPHLLSGNDPRRQPERRLLRRLAVVEDLPAFGLVHVAGRSRGLHRHALLPDHEGQRDARDAELPRVRLIGRPSEREPREAPALGGASRYWPFLSTELDYGLSLMLTVEVSHFVNPVANV